MTCCRQIRVLPFPLKLLADSLRVLLLYRGHKLKQHRESWNLQHRALKAPYWDTKYYFIVGLMCTNNANSTELILIQGILARISELKALHSLSEQQYVYFIYASCLPNNY